MSRGCCVALPRGVMDLSALCDSGVFFNQFNNKFAQMLDSIYHMALRFFFEFTLLA